MKTKKDEVDLTEKDYAETTSAPRRVFTVSQLNRQIRTLLESNLTGIWMEGEVSNFKHHRSGHMYFSIKDQSSQLNVVFFSRQNQYLKFELKDGLQVLIYGRISVYEPRGQYQVYVERIEPKGVGALQLAFLQLKEKLGKEGLFAPEHKKMIPAYPKRVGVITSPTGAAIRDILNVIQRRFAGTHVLLSPVRVQGEGCAEEIAGAIDEMNQYGQVDVLIVGRGGGSLEDLWGFNEERVARSIFASRIPIISAVGHEIDWTISDLVADLRAPTPSAAAELVIQSRRELEGRLSELTQRMDLALRSLLDRYRRHLKTLEESHAFRQPEILVEQFAQRLDELLRQFQNYTKAALSDKRQSLKVLAGKLSALSPLQILGRGYSITFDAQGKPIKELKNISKGSKVKTRLDQGVLWSTIDKMERL